MCDLFQTVSDSKLAAASFGFVAVACFRWCLPGDADAVWCRLRGLGDALYLPSFFVVQAVRHGARFVKFMMRPAFRAVPY